MGFFITFEGGEGAGKSTQVRLLAERLQAEGHNVVPVREPGGTPLGEEVRRWVKTTDVAYEAELFLFAAARAELVATTIKPNLERGAIVVADRFADSTIAYQGYARGIDLDLVRTVNETATGGLVPDLTLLLDLPVEQGLDRIGMGKHAKAHEPTIGHNRLQIEQNPAKPIRDETEGLRFEQQSLDFHRKVRSGFLKLVKESPRRMLLLDATRSANDVSAAIWDAVNDRLIKG